MKKPSSQEARVSSTELVRFLRRASTFYDDRRLGNVPLGRALRDLADRLEAEASSSTLDSESKASRQRLSPTEIAKLSADDVERLLADASLTKTELVSLGTFRFSIPPSALERRPVAEVREAVRSSLLHEQSLAIISEEAERQGRLRQS